MHKRRHVRNVIGLRVLGSYGGDARVGGFAGFGESIVARVEVFSFLGPRILAKLVRLDVGVHVPSTCSGGDPSCWEACHTV
jgi:hypothetical protein